MAKRIYAVINKKKSDLAFLNLIGISRLSSKHHPAVLYTTCEFMGWNEKDCTIKLVSVGSDFSYHYQTFRGNVNNHVIVTVSKEFIDRFRVIHGK